jgi:Holliday junction DNA helicase RuvA
VISGINGIIDTKGDGWLDVNVGGVTLHISIPASLSFRLAPVGKKVKLFTQLTLKNEEPQLYGFVDQASLRVFQLLTGVSGIGPKTALQVLSSKPPQDIATAIISGDASTFTAISGIGRKVANRIILELQPTFEKEGFATSLPELNNTDPETLEALLALGYTQSEARQALRSIGDTSGLSVEEKVRLTLSQLASTS